jgi:hypothetical protein
MLEPVGSSADFGVTKESVRESSSANAGYEPHRDGAYFESKEKRN